MSESASLLLLSTPGEDRALSAGRNLSLPDQVSLAPSGEQKLVSEEKECIRWRTGPKSAGSTNDTHMVLIAGDLYKEPALLGRSGSARSTSGHAQPSLVSDRRALHEPSQSKLMRSFSTTSGLL
jgi:hypothetical protein